MNPDELKFHPGHAWVHESGDEITVGISQYAVEQLGEVLFADLPAAGASITAGMAMGTVESAKAIADLIAPVSGEVTEANPAVYDAPETVNEDPYGAGWLVKVKATGDTDTSGLMTHEAYLASDKD